MTSLFNAGLSGALYMLLGRALVLVTTLPIHEYAHGRAAYWLGDDTAYNAGRLTLNPFAHLDRVGSVMILLFGVGWARPVPVDPRAFRSPKRDMALVALAGPGANLLLALFCLVLYRLAGFAYTLAAVGSTAENVLYGLGEVLLQIVLVNIYLAVFNLLPVPPLDGSRLFGALLPDELSWRFQQGTRMLTTLLFILLLFTDFLDGPLSAVSGWIFSSLVRMTAFVTTFLTRFL